MLIFDIFTHTFSVCACVSAVQSPFSFWLFRPLQFISLLFLVTFLGDDVGEVCLSPSHRSFRLLERTFFCGNMVHVSYLKVTNGQPH